MRPRNAYKDMLNKLVILLIMLSLITKIKLEQMAYEAMFATDAHKIHWSEVQNTDITKT
jgi:hypothetical protein